MRDKVSKIQNSLCFGEIYGWLCLIVVCFDLAIHMVNAEIRDQYLIPIQVLTALLLLFRFAAPSRKITGEAKLLSWYLVWTVATRLLLKDLDAGLKGSVLLAAKGCGLYCMGVVLNPVQREKMLSRTMGIICAVLFFWAACGMLIVLTGSEYLPVVHKNIGMFEDVQSGRYVRYLTFFNTHRNETAPWFMVGLWCMAYFWMICKRKLWRIPIGITAVMFYIVIALQHCRTIYLATAGCAGMLAMLLIMPKAEDKKKLLRWCAALLAALVLIGGLYKGFGISEKAVNRVAQTTSGIYAQIRGYDLEAPENAAEETKKETDSRNLAHDLKTMTGRKSIWRAVFRTRTQEPILAVFGQQEEEVLPYLMEHGGLNYSAGHMHNMFMESLAVTGIPGMLLHVMFVLLVLGRMLRFFFRTHVSVVRRSLTIPMAGLLVYGMLEPLLSKNANLSSVLFFLIAGVLAAWEREEKGIALQKKRENAQNI